MFFQKNEPPDFLFFFVKNVFFGLKKHVFLFLRNKNPFPIVFIASCNIAIFRIAQ